MVSSWSGKYTPIYRLTIELKTGAFDCIHQARKLDLANKACSTASFDNMDCINAIFVQKPMH